MTIRLLWERMAPRRELVTALGWGIAFCMVIPLQSGLMGAMAIGPVIPNAPLLCLVFFGMQYGAGAGVVAGAGLGYALDLVSAGGGAFYVMTYAALGAGSGLVGRVTATLHLSTVLPWLVSASLLLGGAHVVWFHPFDYTEEAAQWVLVSLLPQAGYDAVFGLAVSLAWRWWFPPSRDSTKAALDFFTSGRFPGSLR